MDLNKKSKITIKVFQHDFIPGFAAYRAGSLTKHAKAHVVINVGDFLGAVYAGDFKKEELPYIIAESLFHEFVHVLEEWAGVEFNEEKIETLIEKYQRIYDKKK